MAPKHGDRVAEQADDVPAPSADGAAVTVVVATRNRREAALATVEALPALPGDPR